MSITHIHTVWDCFRIQIFCKYFVNNFDDEGATPVTVLSAVPFYLFVPGNKGKHSGVAKLGHSWHLESDTIFFFWWGASLCTGGCLMPSLTSTHQMPGATCLQLVTTKIDSRYGQMSSWVTKSRPGWEVLASVIVSARHWCFTKRDQMSAFQHQMHWAGRHMSLQPFVCAAGVEIEIHLELEGTGSFLRKFKVHLSVP